MTSMFRSGRSGRTPSLNVDRTPPTRRVLAALIGVVTVVASLVVTTAAPTAVSAAPTATTTELVVKARVIAQPLGVAGSIGSDFTLTNGTVFRLYDVHHARCGSAAQLCPASPMGDLHDHGGRPMRHHRAEHQQSLAASGGNSGQAVLGRPREPIHRPGRRAARVHQSQLEPRLLQWTDEHPVHPRSDQRNGREHHPKSAPRSGEHKRLHVGGLEQPLPKFRHPGFVRGRGQLVPQSASEGVVHGRVEGRAGRRRVVVDRRLELDDVP